MAVIKCKMCGGDLQIVEGNSVCECEYCGSKQTVPIADNEKKMTLFARANRLLRNCEFDKASGVFETIVAEFPEEAEAYWGLVLCKYGIEYVDDPATGKKIPTCHRSSFDSVLDDSNFEQACENTDSIARRVYRDEARAIEELRKKIIEVSGKEDPYDIFISYKETDEKGDRTLDSVIAQDIYKELTNDGYRVFFSRISLEDKLGTEYEPYIFAALNSAKVMLVVGTDFENFDAVWVKNEWSRFLKLIASGQKKILIPVFKNMDAYDMPKEFVKLAAQDMGKVGAMQDLIRGIEKLTGKKKEEDQTETVQVSQGANPTIDSLLDRAYVFLEDQEWEKAAEYADKVLDLNVRSGKAYLVKLMADLHVEHADDLAKMKVSFSEHPQYIKIQRFGGEKLNKQVAAYIQTINDRNQAAFEQNERKRKLQIKSPEMQNLKDNLAFVRERCDILEKRIQDHHGLFIINSDGQAECGLDYRAFSYQNFKRTKTQCEEWSKSYVLSSFIDFQFGSLYALTADGDILAATPPMHFQKEHKNWETISQWHNISSVIKTCGYTYGLQDNGTVVVAGEISDYVEYHGQDQVGELSNIVKLTDSGYNGRVFFVKSDGTAAATQFIGSDVDNSGWDEVSLWTNLHNIITFAGRLIGFRKDGSMIATRYLGKGEKRNAEAVWKEASAWSDIIGFKMISFGRIVGVTAYGEILVTNYYDTEPEDKKLTEAYQQISKWGGIAKLYYYSNWGIIGLRYDGSVVVADYSDSVLHDEFYRKARNQIKTWKNVAALSFFLDYAVGIRQDGTLVTTDVYDRDTITSQPDKMKFFRSYDNLPDEIANSIARAEEKRRAAAEASSRVAAEKAAAEKAEAKRIEAMKKARKDALTKEELQLRTELSKIKGLFAGSKKAKIESRLIEIEKELKNLA